MQIEHKCHYCEKEGLNQLKPFKMEELHLCKNHYLQEVEKLSADYRKEAIENAIFESDLKYEKKIVLISELYRIIFKYININELDEKEFQVFNNDLFTESKFLTSGFIINLSFISKYEPDLFFYKISSYEYYLKFDYYQTVAVNYFLEGEYKLSLQLMNKVSESYLNYFKKISKELRKEDLTNYERKVAKAFKILEKNF